MKQFFITLCLVGIVIAGSYQDSTYQKLPVAVLTLDAKGVSQQEADILTERLRSAFVQDGRYQVVERSQMESILEEQGFQQTGCTTNECLVQAGMILGVQNMVGGSVGKIGERFAVDIRLFDVESTRIIKAVSKNVHGTVDRLLDVMPEIARELSNASPTGPIQNGLYRSEKIRVGNTDLDDGLEAVGDAIEYAAEQVSQSLENAGVAAGGVIEKVINPDGDKSEEYLRGRKEGKLAAHDIDWKQTWMSIPAGMGFVSAVSNGSIWSGLILGWVTKQVQLNVEGSPKLPPSLTKKIDSEHVDYKEAFTRAYIQERNKIRENKMDIGCWAGAVIGALII